MEKIINELKEKIMQELRSDLNNMFEKHKIEEKIAEAIGKTTPPPADYPEAW